MDKNNDEIKVMQAFIREFNPFFYDSDFAYWSYDDYKTEIKSIVANMDFEN